MMCTFVARDGIATSSQGEIDLSPLSMRVQPNLAREVLYLPGASLKESLLRFIKLDGEIFKEIYLPSFDGAIQIDVDQLPEGLLFMQWQSFEGNAVRKAVINH